MPSLSRLLFETIPPKSSTYWCPALILIKDTFNKLERFFFMLIRPFYSNISLLWFFITAGGDYVCLHTVQSGNNYYLSVWNNDTTVGSGDYQFSCLVSPQEIGNQFAWFVSYYHNGDHEVFFLVGPGVKRNQQFTWLVIYFCGNRNFQVICLVIPGLTRHYQSTCRLASSRVTMVHQVICLVGPELTKKNQFTCMKVLGKQGNQLAWFVSSIIHGITRSSAWWARFKQALSLYLLGKSCGYRDNQVICLVGPG